MDDSTAFAPSKASAISVETDYRRKIALVEKLPPKGFAKFRPVPSLKNGYRKKRGADSAPTSGDSPAPAKQEEKRRDTRTPP